LFRELETAKRRPSQAMCAVKKIQLEHWKNASPETKLLCAFKLYDLGMKLKRRTEGARGTD